MIPTLSNYINGEHVAPKNGKYLDNINPSTNEVINKVPDSDSNDVNLAIAAAKNAYPTWRSLTLKKRAEYLRKIAAEMKKQTNELALAETTDMGKPIILTTNVDIPEAFNQFEKYANHILVVSTPYYQMEDAVCFEHRDPIGIVGLITPWNFPLMLLCTKVAAAIACGNTCVCKPTELAPTTAYLFTKILTKIGLPPGVVNVIHGCGASAGEPIVRDPNIGAVSFTGGSLTGSRISAIAAPLLKKLQLELGGKNAAIVFNDCYFDETIDGISRAGFFNTGQVCCSGSRLLIQRSIMNKFIDALKQYCSKNWNNKIGDPTNLNTMMGPLVSSGHYNKVVSYINLAKEEGGNIVFGGGYKENLSYTKLNEKLLKGNFVEPTIVLGLSNECRCATEEIFGPIITVHPFDSEEEAIKIANSTNYGLAASVWTSDIRRGQRVARQLEAGSVWINCYLTMDERAPFGGYKNSGINRENGLHSIDFFSEIKSITSKL